MKKARLQVRVDEDLKKAAEEVAAGDHTTLSALITQYLVDLVKQRRSPSETT